MADSVLAYQNFKKYGTINDYTVHTEGSSSSSSSSSTDVLDQYLKSFEEAKAANEQRYQQGLGILDKAIKRYKPGGSFGKGAMAQYQTGKTNAMAMGMQSLVGSGLSNTTVAAGMPLKYEQEVGTPFRLQLEDLRMQNLTKAEQAKTQFIQDRSDMYPDLAQMMQYQAQSSSAPGQGGGGTTYTGLGPNAKAGLDIFGEPLGQFGKKTTSSTNRIETPSYGSDRRQSAPKGPQTEDTKAGTMSDADFQDILNQNMGRTYDQPDPAQTGPFQPGTAPGGWSGPEGSKPQTNTTGYGSLDDWMDFSY